MVKSECFTPAHSLCRTQLPMCHVLMVVSHVILSSCPELGSSFGTQCRYSRSLELEPDSRELRGDLKQLFHIGSNFLYVKKEELVSRQNERILLLSNSTKIIVIYWIIVSRNRNLPKQEWSHIPFRVALFICAVCKMGLLVLSRQSK